MKTYTISRTIERWIEVEAEDYDSAMALASGSTNWNENFESEHVEVIEDGMIVDVTGGEDAN